MAFAFGIGFQFPVLLVFLQLVGVLTPQTADVELWRYAIVVIFVVAAVITPSGDPISMIGAGGPDDRALLRSRRASASSSQRRQAARRGSRPAGLTDWP